MTKSFKNTKVPYDRQEKNEEFDEKLRSKISKEKYKYDFKYIKKEFKSTEEMDQGIYLSR